MKQQLLLCRLGVCSLYFATITCVALLRGRALARQRYFSVNILKRLQLTSTLVSVLWSQYLR